MPSPVATFTPTASTVSNIPGTNGFQGTISLGNMLENALEHNPITATPLANLIGQAEAQVLDFAAGASFAPFSVIFDDLAQINSILSSQVVFGPQQPSYSIPKATTLTVPAPGLEAATPTNAPHLVAGAGHGGVTLGDGSNPLMALGSFAYSPDAAYVGPDSFAFQNTSNGTPVGGVTTVQLSVTSPVNSAPVANNDLFQKTFTPGSPGLQVDAAHGVLANDVDPFGKALSVHLVNGPTQGTVSLAANGGFAYTPNVAGPVVDHFTYTDSNGSANSPPQTAWVAITPATGSTVQAVNHSYVVPANQPTDLTALQGVLAGDTGPTAAELAAFARTVPQHGTVSLAPDGAFEYIPTTGFTGTDQFSYLAADGHGALGVGLVTLHVEAHASVAMLG